MKVFLIGFMGSGKTTLGRELANMLQWSFVDLDEYIEEKHHTTILRLFDSSGQDYFRRVESQALREVTQTEENIIIATGGGTPCYHDGMHFMKKEGLAIYLKVSVEVLVERLLSSIKERPLLSNRNPLELKREIGELLSSRVGCYEQSEVTVENEAQGTAKVLNQIINVIV